MEDNALAVPVFTASFLDSELIDCMQKFIAIAADTMHLDLSALEGVTIANDFDFFLEQFDLGFGTKDKLSSSKGMAVCVGITPEVLRNGKLWSHVILPRQIAIKLKNADGSKGKAEVQYIVSHELAHADEHARSARALSEEIIALHRMPEMFKVANRAIWGDYYACRTAARAGPMMTAIFAEMLHTSHAAMLDAIEPIKAQLHRDNDLTAAQSKAINLAIGLFVSLARLLGHLDGLQSSIRVATPTIHTLMQSHQDEAEVLTRLHRTLQDSWGSFPEWHGLQALHGIFDDSNSLLELF